MTSELTEVTRRSIIDHLRASETKWFGRLDDVEFLERIYDLQKMPSTDSRMRTARGDISQHRIDWNDWAEDWVFGDPRFDLLRAPDEVLLRFLTETVHPVVRPDSDEARALVTVYNAHLKPDGWQLIEASEISGKPVFTASKTRDRAQVLSEPTGWQKVDRQTQEIRSRLNSADSEEEFQAIGLLCREALTSVAQEVFDANKHPTIDGVGASSTDAGRMLEGFFNVELKGSANEEARVQARGALKLALALQHKRTADGRMAALCAEAAFSVVNICAILVGRR